MPPVDGDGTLNAITVDVEEHFQVSAFAGVVRRRDWESFDSRVEANTDRLLGLFDEAGVRGTFFVLGWIGERHPRLVRRIADLGHEIASHGHSHRLVFEQGPQEFREETRRSKEILENACGREVRGYRAASFSITRRNLWALDVLVDAGFAYDSSLFPVYHVTYGIPGAPRGIYTAVTAAGRRLLELPPSTLRIGRLALPVAGGAYLRIFPRALTRWAIRRLNRREGLPAVVYVHPWELDPRQPLIEASWFNRFRHYSRLSSTADKLRDLLSRFRFATMAEVIARHPDRPDVRLA